MKMGIKSIKGAFAAPFTLVLLVAPGVVTHLTVDGTVVVTGDILATTTRWGMLTPPPRYPPLGEDEPYKPAAFSNHSGTLHLAWDASSRVHLEVLTRKHVGFKPDGFGGFTWQRESERENHEIADPASLAVACGPGCFIHISPIGDTPTRFSLAPHKDRALPLPDTRLRGVAVAEVNYAWSARGMGVVLPVPRADDATPLVLDGPHRILIFESTGTLTTRNGTDLTWETGRDPRDPQAPAYEGAWRVVTIRATGPARITSLPEGGATLSAKEVSYEVDGAVAATRVRGTLHQSGERITLGGDSLSLSGRVHVTPTCTQTTRTLQVGNTAECTYTISGTPNAIYVNGRPIGRNALVVRSLVAVLGAGLLLWASRLVDAARLALAILHFRMRKEKAFENAQRRRVYEIIRQKPGIHFNEILRASGMSHGNLMYHLNVLRQFQLVRSHEVGGFRLYWPMHEDHSPEAAQRALTLSRDRSRVLAARVLAQPGITQRELATLEDIPQASVSRHLRRLEAASLVQSRVESGGGRAAKRYFPAPDLQSALARRQIEPPTSAPGEAPPATRRSAPAGRSEPDDAA